MIKNKYLIFFVLLVFIIAVFILSKDSKMKIQKTSDTKKNSVQTSLKPEQAVMNFYGTYLAFKGDLLSPKSFENSDFLSEDFKKKLKEEISNNKSVNPIICSIEKPSELKIHSATISSQFAEVLVTLNFQNRTRNNILKLEYNNDKYKINDIICN